MIHQWGKSTVTTGTPLAVTFPKAFPANLFSIVVSCDTPTAATNDYYTTSSGLTGTTLNVNGTAGTQTVYWRALGN